MARARFYAVAVVMILVCTVVPFRFSLAPENHPTTSSSTTGDALRVNATRQMDRAQALSLGRDICSVQDWWAFVHEHLPEALTFLDVGANKGFVSATWLQLWWPELGVSPEALLPHVRAQAKAHNDSFAPCGPCSCQPGTVPPLRGSQPRPLSRLRATRAVTPPPTGERRSGFVVHSIEPSRPVAEISVALISELFPLVAQRGGEGTPLDGASWLWHTPLAASDAPGELPLDTHSGEGSKLVPEGTAPKNGTVLTRVPVTTLDLFASMNGLWGPENRGSRKFTGPGIDVLKIDAEGFDAKVLAGAAGLIAAGVVSVVVWEMPVDLPVTFDPVASAAVVEAAAATAASHSGVHGASNSSVILKAAAEAAASTKTSSETVVVRSLQEMVMYLSAAGLECYIPGKHGVTLSLRHWHDGIELPEFGRLNRGNALCASRSRAPGLVAALDARSLALMSDEQLPLTLQEFILQSSRPLTLAP